MSLEKLFESLDEKVFTPELKESLETQFNEAVETKATVIAEEKINDEIESLNEKANDHIDLLEEKSQEYIEAKQEELVESLDKYLERVIEEFVSEAKTALDESAKSDKADMIIEAFDSMLTAVGVDVANIVEAKDNNDVQSKLDETIEKYDNLIEENINMKEENDKLIKMGVISEMKEGLSIVESEKFEKLADIVEFSKDEDYAVKLQTIKESVKGTVEENLDEDADSEDSVEKPVYAHLI